MRQPLVLHRWFAPPVQLQSWILTPLAVPFADASRQSPLCRMVPLLMTCHCWFADPLHRQTWTTAFGALLLKRSSRQSPILSSLMVPLKVVFGPEVPISHPKDTEPLVPPLSVAVTVTVKLPSAVGVPV